MIPADALSRRHDHSKGIEDIPDTIGLPEELFVNLLDLDLQDAVITAQAKDETALDALSKLQTQGDQDPDWHLETKPDGTTCLFFKNRLYIPDDSALRRQIVRDHHDSPAAGHTGVLATLRSLRLTHWWPRMASFVRKIKSLEGRDGVLSISIAHGFPWADVSAQGTRVLVVTDGETSDGRVLAAALGRELRSLRDRIEPPWTPLEQALDQAIAAPAGPIVLADVADNAGGGAPSDSTFMLRAMLARMDVVALTAHTVRHARAPIGYA